MVFSSSAGCSTAVAGGCIDAVNVGVSIGSAVDKLAVAFSGTTTLVANGVEVVASNTFVVVVGCNTVSGGTKALADMVIVGVGTVNVGCDNVCFF